MAASALPSAQKKDSVVIYAFGKTESRVFWRKAETGSKTRRSLSWRPRLSTGGLQEADVFFSLDFFFREGGGRECVFLSALVRSLAVSAH